LDARKEIRAVLTPQQRNRYDLAPERVGGGAEQDFAFELKQLDQLVHLTREQFEKAKKTFASGVLAQAQFADEENGPETRRIRANTQEEIRALLTPEQLKIYNSTPDFRGGGGLPDPSAGTRGIERLVTLTHDQVARITAIYQDQADLLLEL